jgi:Zn-finger domain-containing protein
MSYDQIVSKIERCEYSVLCITQTKQVVQGVRYEAIARDYEVSLKEVGINVRKGFRVLSKLYREQVEKKERLDTMAFWPRSRYEIQTYQDELLGMCDQYLKRMPSVIAGLKKLIAA